MAKVPAGHPELNYAAVDQVVDLTEPELESTPARYFPHRYDIHGLLLIGSEVPLWELEYFRAPRLQGPYDVQIRRGRIRKGGLRRRAVVTQTTSPLGVRYEEHSGRLGADVEIRMTSPIEIVAGRLLCLSPHVLYTNVVEPLLRFVLVSKQCVLLHAACLNLTGRGVLVSAQTDTGKTSTVLGLLREGAGLFLSDDMTIVRPDGTALCYPKPLTISHHTLRAVQADGLTRWEWRRLGLQSRLHSKQGRAIGTRLGQLNLPIMALNATTQLLVPPPKYVVQRLVPCPITTTAHVGELFVIERGAPGVDEIEPVDLVEVLVHHSDDAYGFPPFGYLAPALVVEDEGYEQLRARERSLLEQAMSGVRARRVISDNFGWAEVIQQLVAATDGRQSTSAVASRPSQTIEHRGR